MAKAVLVMDMPEDCTMCKFWDSNNDECYAVGAAEPWSTDQEKTRADWCPLVELPEKKEELSVEEYEFGGLGKAFVSGWNACLDKISEEPLEKGEASKTNPTGRVMKKNLCKKVISF